jgi:hypothetical protein
MKLQTNKTIRSTNGETKSWWEEIEVKDVDSFCENQCYSVIEENKEELSEYYSNQPDKLRELFNCLNPNL